ncbi:MAG TPA: hypothetical protein VGX68_26110 [Thermoanaerobaculia bacterium]|jgi:hypothetical protein|nr:hypothetical protein [Thermoanaerobaculia bacterium]
MIRRSRATLGFLLAIIVPAAILLGKVLYPQAALYARILSPAALLWIGILAKLAFLAVACVVAARSAGEFEGRNPSRLAWRLLAAGLLGFVLGQATQALERLLAGAIPSPSAADAFFGLGYPVLIFALVQFLRAYAATGFPIGSRAGHWLLGVAVAAFLGLLGYSILIPVVWTPAPLLEKLVNVAYPAFDLILLALAVVLLRVSVRFRGGAVWKVWIFLLSGFILMCVADIFFAFFSGLGQTHLVDMADAMYVLAFGCIAAGVLAQRELLLR